MDQVVIVSGDPSPTLETLNRKGIQKLYELIDSLDVRSEPEMVKVCIESLSKLNASLRNNDALTPQETDEEKASKARSALVQDILKKD